MRGGLLKNSFILTAQPLLMNLVSLFAIGYIARRLGTSDFGIFNFVTTFTMLFYPLAVAGLDRIAVRDLAGMKSPAAYANRMVASRLVTTALAVAVIVLAAGLMGYDRRTTTAIALGCLIFFFRLVLEALLDIFNAAERMEFTGLAETVAGVTLTALSVVVVWLGFGLYELIGVYALGQLAGCAAAAYLLGRHFFPVRPRFNRPFFGEKLAEGSHFLLMSMMWFGMTRIDTVLLSKSATMATVGVYTAAMYLITRLGVVPNALATSLLPAVSSSHGRGDPEEVGALVRSVLTRVALLALPLTIGIAFYADELISVVFGAAYRGAGTIFRICVWAFLLNCVAFSEFSVLAALHRQRGLLTSYAVTMAYCVAANVVLIARFEAVGAALAFVSTQLLLTTLFTVFTLRAVPRAWSPGDLVKILSLNGALAALLLALKPAAPLGTIPLAALAYAAGCFALGLITAADVTSLRRLLLREA